MKKIFVFLFLIALSMLLSSCREGTTPTDQCEYGKRRIIKQGTVLVNPSDGHQTTLYRCYNGEECSESINCWEYSAVGGYEADWYQIVLNSSGEMMINVSAFVMEENDDQPGWVACKDVNFMEDDDYYANKLLKTVYEQYLLCKFASE